MNDLTDSDYSFYPLRYKFMFYIFSFERIERFLYSVTRFCYRVVSGNLAGARGLPAGVDAVGS